MKQVLDLVPRVLAAGSGLLTGLWGLRVSWGFARGDEPGGVVAGLGMLLLVTPLLAVGAAAFSFWVYSLLLAPLHVAVDAAQARLPHD